MRSSRIPHAAFDIDPADDPSTGDSFMVLMWLEAWGGAAGLWRGRRAFASASKPIVRMPRATRQGRGSAASLRQRPFWIRIDPRDSRRAAIGGSFAQVCAALERLAAEEGRNPG